MAGSRDRTIYWDTNIFLAWLKGEANTPEEIAGMREHRDLVVRREARLATSIITVTEILQSTLKVAARDKLLALTGHRNFRYVEVNPGVAWLAHEIRDYYYRLDDGLPTVSAPDAFHLASAIVTPGCRELYTFDGKNGKLTDDSGNRTLIPLSGTVAGKYPLTIAVPSTPDVTLLDSLGHE
jgi:predicted nucleic acid-binding protein